MIAPRDAYDRAEEMLFAAHERGELSQADFNTELRELARDYRDEAENAAWDAYYDEQERW